ncbi:MAG: Ig-like domain-containing protein, partial [Candidatus Thorarchaeota archaeon]
MLVAIKNSYTKHSLKAIVISLLMVLSFIVSLTTFHYQPVRSHSSAAYPTEIFSIWNNSPPIFDGEINFSYSIITNEWSYAAIYDLYSDTNTERGKILLQNNNSDLFIGIDGTDFQVEDPTTDWGFNIYFDVDHNGYLSTNDISIYFVSSTSGDNLYYRCYNYSTKSWDIIETGTDGIPLTTSNILLIMDFKTSVFEETNNHRQYELKIPFSAISSDSGKTIGFGIEVTSDFTTAMAGVTWPYILDNLFYIRTRASVWGDLSFGQENADNFDYIIEKNLKVKSSAYGKNNGTFVTTGDIDGNGDKEIIASSNRTVLGDNNLFAIFDYVSGDYQRIWASWLTSHQALITFPIQGVVCYDFDGDGMDEIYAVGKSTSILRFSIWNTTLNDFEISETIFTHSSQLMGYITIGDANNDSLADLVFGDQNGYVSVLVYNSVSDSFSHDARSPFRTKIDVQYPYRIHGITVGNVDGDFWDEILFDYQYTADNQLSETKLLIYERTIAKFQDNTDDDLPANSIATTIDNFGHTIVVADVDNDMVNEIILASKNYLRVFENNSFTDPSPRLEFLINDGISSPLMGGGATVTDLNDDGKNELIFGANNGTLYIGTVTDLGGSMSFALNWSADFGSNLGFHNTLIHDDLNGDGSQELIIGDNYGQILIIGKGNTPSLTITSPSSGYVSSQDNVLVTWEASDDHHTVQFIDLFVKGVFKNRFGGSQNSAVTYLTPGQNNITLIAHDFSGLTKTQSITVKFDVKAPQVTITSPANNYKTTSSSVEVNYFATDPDGDFYNDYRIYLNGTNIHNTTLETYTVNLPSSGIWNITIVAVDVTLLVGKSSIIVIRDNIPPNIEITSPLDGAAVKTQQIEVQWTASDSLTSLDHYDIYLDGGYYGTTANKYYDVYLDVDKSYTILVRAFDILGNYQSDSIIVKRDTISPTVEVDPIALPILDTIYYTDNPSLAITWNATDNTLGSGISQTQIVINGLVYNSYPYPTTGATINFVDNGLKNIYVNTYDKAGNVGSDYFAVIYDTLQPNLTITSPVNNFVTGLNYVTISWNAVDNGVGLKEYIIKVDGVTEATITDPDITYYYLAIPLEKTYLITVRAVDMLEYYIEKSISVTYDSNAPTVYLTNPNEMTSYTNSTIIQVNWAISNLLIDHFAIYINGTNYDNYTGSVFTTTITLAYTPGEYPLYNITIYAIATDLNVYFDYRWIKIDKTNPIIFITNPNNLDSITNVNLNVEWYGEDEGTGISKYIIQIANLTIIKSGTANSHVVNIYGLDNWENLTIIAYDNSGNKAFDTISLKIALLAPAFSTTLEMITITNNMDIQ